MTLTVGSCFAGIGGIDLGLEAAGPFETIWHSEIKPSANRVMAHQFPSSEPLGSITDLTDGLFAPPPVDVLAGGPPCQGVSIGNSYGRLGLDDSRSQLFHTYAELIALVGPRWIIMEQVTGLFTSKDDYATVVNTLEGLGYAIAQIVVNSLAYVPQTRERLIIVGHRDPDAAARALLPLAQDGGCDPLAGRPTRRRAATATPAGVGAGGYRKSTRPASVNHGETWVTADYANTLTLNDVGVSRATVIVIDELGMPRVMTPEEWEGCHGFPAGWTIAAGSDVDRWQCLGNAVSPPVALRIGAGIAAVEGL